MFISVFILSNQPVFPTCKLKELLHPEWPGGLRGQPPNHINLLKLCMWSRQFDLPNSYIPPMAYNWNCCTIPYPSTGGIKPTIITDYNMVAGPHRSLWQPEVRAIWLEGHQARKLYNTDRRLLYKSLYGTSNHVVMCLL